MSTVIETLDLTLFGCPLHYIKARDALRVMEVDQALLLIVNKGKAVDEVQTSLRKDGHVCSIEEEESVTTTIRVIKKND
ncbi:hypothetical protein A9Q78_07030 [Methylophaga sp. 41_12_T18]|nr:hypothetical protein A9Q78_07030 [Methylophaga sp. 41_12_T18]